MMKANVSNVTAVLLLSAMIAGCGGEQDAAEDTASSSERTEPVWDVKQEGTAAAESMEESAEAAGDAMQEAGDEATEMANEAGEQAREMAEETSQMASEAGDQAEQAMADAAGTMSTDDASASGDSGDPCVVDVEVGDSLAYSVDSISVPSSCASVTINLAHTGSLPKEAMGHNWVLAPADSVDAIGQAGTSAGLENNYVPDDDRIVAATEVIGGGERTSVTFSLDDLEDGVDYAYVCTFPGHWTVMRGPFNVE